MRFTKAGNKRCVLHIKQLTSFGVLIPGSKEMARQKFLIPKIEIRNYGNFRQFSYSLNGDWFMYVSKGKKTGANLNLHFRTDYNFKNSGISLFVRGSNLLNPNFYFLRIIY